MPVGITQAERYEMGARMLAWRSQYQVTQARAARFLGVAREVWARWERGEIYPLGYAFRLTELIQTDPHEGRPRQERFYQRKPRAAHAVQRRMFRVSPGTASSSKGRLRRDVR